MLRIKEVLKEKNMNQINLAEKLDITTVGLNKIINGNPTIETLLKIAGILDVDVRDLIIPTKKSNTETLYIQRDGEIVPFGIINRM